MRVPILALSLLAAGCTTALVGAGAAVVVGSAAVLAHQCYDHVYVTVLGPAGRTCDATVVATRSTDRVELNSCFHAALTEGTWTLRASAPGLGSAATTVIVAPPDHCIEHVQTIEMALGAPPVATVRPPATIATPPRALPPPPPPPVATPESDGGAPGDAGSDAAAD